MKARIQSVDDLKRIASQSLKEEFDKRFQEAMLEGAMQGMAYVMYVLEVTRGWKDKRQQELFKDMVGIMELPETAPWLGIFQGQDIKKHIEEKYGVRFDELLERSTATPPK